jgi:hypothetical protein
MSTTSEEVWALLRDLIQSQQETDRKFKETDHKFAETDRKFKETDRKFAETDRKFKETDRKFAETDRKFKETDRRFQKLTELIGRQGNRLGEFVQEMVRPAIIRLFRERGLPVHQVAPNLTAYDDNGQSIMEIDLLALNEQTAVVVECKSHLSVDDVNDHLERLDAFKRCFPQYDRYQLLGAVAGMVVPDQVARFAYRKGLFVLAQSDQTMTIRNDDQFTARVW